MLVRAMNLSLIFITFLLSITSANAETFIDQNSHHPPPGHIPRGNVPTLSLSGNNHTFAIEVQNDRSYAPSSGTILVDMVQVWVFRVHYAGMTHDVNLNQNFQATISTSPIPNNNYIGGRFNFPPENNHTINQIRIYSNMGAVMLDEYVMIRQNDGSYLRGYPYTYHPE